jgi:hypothetical protein
MLQLPLWQVPLRLHDVPSGSAGNWHVPEVGLHTPAMVQAPAGCEQLIALTHEHTPAAAAVAAVAAVLPA